MLHVPELYACSAVIIALLVAAAKWNRKRGWVKVRPEPFVFSESLFAPPDPKSVRVRMEPSSTDGLLALARALGVHAEINVATPTPSPGTEPKPQPQN